MDVSTLYVISIVIIALIIFGVLSFIFRKRK